MNGISQYYDAELARRAAFNLAHYLSTATLAELAGLTGALAAECSYRGLYVADLLGSIQARLEAAARAGAV